MGLLVIGLACGGPGATTTDATTEASATGTSTTGATTADETTAGADTQTTGPVADPGELVILTYNVAGLPEGISSSHPEVNTPQISPLLSSFALVLVQEDFYYHAALAADASHPYPSTPYMEPPDIADLGDGLNRFSQSAFDDPVERVPWHDCSGQLDCASDCLATKGWSYSRHALDEGVELDVYNLHMEAGSCPEDLVIRAVASAMLVDQVTARSKGRAVVIAGDFNMRFTDPDDAPNLEGLLAGLGLQDACQALDCGDERIDKVLFRGSASLELAALEWWVPPEFIDGEGEDLSDHKPVAVRLAYTPQ